MKFMTKRMKTIHTMASVVALLVLDLMWVALVMRRAYKPMIQAIQGKNRDHDAYNQSGALLWH